MINNIQAGFFVLGNYYNYETTPQRKVEHYEIEIIEKCSGACFINGIKYMHKNANLLFSKPGDVRFTTGKLECKFIKFKCSDEKTIKILNDIPSGMILTDCTRLQEVISSAKMLVNSKKANDRMELFSLVFKAISLLATYHSFAPREKANSSDMYTSRIINTKEYLDTHYSDKITLEMMAAPAFLSPNFFRVKFLEIMGISPHDYLIQVRVSKAKNLLENTDTPLSEIALMCGFESQAYMNYVFKKETGTSPGKYRRNRLN